MTTSQAQQKANQRNAMRSTGPRTVQGKQRSKLNSLKHGLTTHSQLVIIPGESEAQWKQLRSAIVHDLSPQGALEQLLCERVALLSWRMRRLAKHELAISTEKLANLGEADASTLAERKTLLDKIAEAKKGVTYWKTKQHLFAVFDQPKDTKVNADTAFHVFEYFGMTDPRYTVDPQDPEFLQFIGADVVLPDDDLTVDEFDLVEFSVHTLDLGAEFIGRLAKETGDDAIRKTRASIEKELSDAQQNLEQHQQQLSTMDKAMATRLEYLAALHGYPDDEKLDKIMRHEAHLQKQFLGVLHEFQRAQSSRLHGTSVVPTALDITVSTSNQDDIQLQGASVGGTTMPRLKQVTMLRSPVGC